MKKNVNRIVKACLEMGRIEGQVAYSDMVQNISSNDFSRYLVNAEIADLPADKHVLEEIADKIKNGAANKRLKKIYTNYKSKYYKS